MEEITVVVPRYGNRKRLRVRQSGRIVDDYANPLEAEAVLRWAGVLDKMTEVQPNNGVGNDRRRR